VAHCDSIVCHPSAKGVPSHNAILSVYFSPKSKKKRLKSFSRSRKDCFVWKSDIVPIRNIGESRRRLYSDFKS
jgi:hypothetical protein